jgi:SAM-dependent MidA family methyltransferase
MTTTAERLRDRIAATGPIPFAAFMEEALYGEGGYYARETLPIGEGGDFVTGSSLSPLFGQATARLLRRLDGVLGESADYLEVGYGGGVHLASLAASLKPGSAVGVSSADASRAAPPRRLLAWDRVARAVPAGVRRLDSLDELAEHPLRGLVFSYELFDALPVHRLIGRSGGAGALGELWVALDGAGRFAWQEGELSDPALAALVGRPLEPGQVADLAPGAAALYAALAARLEAGLLVTCDYGFTVERLLDPRVRRFGTLACYQSQQVHRDPFRDPGREDLSAHVDFSALIGAGETAGLATLAFTRQAPWLAAWGLFEGLAEASPATRIEAQQLLALDGMGEEIRVLVQGRGVEPGRLPELARIS